MAAADRAEPARWARPAVSRAPVYPRAVHPIVPIQNVVRTVVAASVVYVRQITVACRVYARSQEPEPRIRAPYLVAIGPTLVHQGS